MKYLILYIIVFVCFITRAQDKIYLLDGSKKVVKILEVGIDAVEYSDLSESGAPFLNSKETLPNRKILLVEYKNGKIEIFNQPEKSSISTSQGLVTSSIKKTDNRLNNNNFIYFNTLALCNADIAGFYEHLVPSKKIGLGLMVAYNFNPYAISPNLFIAVLYNAKKNYDAGGFINFYPSAFKRRVTFSYGILIKYTAFSFSKNTGTATNVVYVPANGSQLATIVNIGTHSNLSKNLFLKTMIGLGGFTLKGDYKQQFNAILSENNNGTDYNYTFLPKLYFGLNLGFYL